MAGQDFQVRGLMSVAVGGFSDVARMNMFLNQAANAGANSARAFQSLQLASSYAAQSIGKFVDTFKSVTGQALVFEDTMARAIGVTKNNTLQLDNMRGVAMTLSSTVHGPNELAKALLELNKAGIEGSQALNDVRVVSDLALITQTDMATATVALANVFKAWGGPLDTSQKLLNKFASAANQSTFEMGSLLKAMEYVQRTAIPMGMSLDSSLAGVMLMSPITGPNSKAGTSLGGAIGRLSNPATIKALQAAGINPYGKGGTGRREFFEVWADVYEKYGRKTPDGKTDTLMGKVFSPRDRAALAMVEKAYTTGFTFDTGFGNKTVYGREAFRQAKASLSSGMTLADQSANYQNSPAGAWKIMGATWEKLMVEVGQGFLKSFMSVKGALLQVINGLRGLNGLAGGLMAPLAMGFGLLGLMKVGSLGVGAIAKSAAWFGGKTPGPINTGLSDRIRQGQSADALFYSYQGFNRMGYAGAYRARSSANVVDALAGIKDETLRNKAINAAGSNPIRFMNNFNATERAQLNTPEVQAAMLGRNGIRGRWAEWHANYGGTDIGKAIRRGAGIGANLGGMGGVMAGALIPGNAGMTAGLYAGGGIGGAVGGAVGGLASLASTIASTLGPMVLFGAVIGGVTWALERLQKAAEAQEKIAIKDRGMINDLPTIFRGILGMDQKGNVDSSLISLLKNSGVAASTFSQLVQEAAMIQQAYPGTGGNRAATLATMARTGRYSQMLGNYIAEKDPETGAPLTQAGRWVGRKLSAFLQGKDIVDTDPLDPDTARKLKRSLDEQYRTLSSSLPDMVGGIDFTQRVKSIPALGQGAGAAFGAASNRGKNPFFFSTGKEAGALGADILLGAKGPTTPEAYATAAAAVIDAQQKDLANQDIAMANLPGSLDRVVDVQARLLEQLQILSVQLARQGDDVKDGAQSGTYQGLEKLLALVAK